MPDESLAPRRVQESAVSSSSVPFCVIWRFTGGMRSPIRRLTIIAAVAGLTLSACSEDISSREVMIETLTEQGSMSLDDATCVANEMFDGGTYTEDDLKTVAKGFTDDDGNEKIEGFTAYAEGVIDGCLGAN